MKLRWYQSDACNAAWHDLCANAGNSVIVAPCGTGKSVLIAELARRTVEAGYRVLVLAHRKELLEQNAEKLRALLPWNVRVGIFSAGLNQRATDEPVICAGIQSVHKRASEFGARHLVLLDECHLCPFSGEGMYRTFLDDLRAINPKLRMIGLTATPYRTDNGKLCRDDGLFQRVCYDIPVRKLIDEGWLCGLTNQPTQTVVDTSGLHVRGGEFVAREMEDLFDGVIGPACQEIVSLTPDRKSVLVFCSGVEHARHVRDLLEKLTNEQVGLVTGETLPIERASQLESFKSGRLRLLCNVDVLTTGFDAPGIDCIAVLRATMSPGLFAQIVGRGLRTSPAKADCIAEGQRVLTDQGLIPIEQVTLDMKLWDGVEYVTHCGIILRGQQDVISYAGLTATEDHNVWTKEGWKTIRECRSKQIPIAVTGDEGSKIYVADSCFRGGCSQGRQGASIHDDAMQRVRNGGIEGIRHHQERDCRLSQMREEAKQIETMSWRSEVAAKSLYISEGTLFKQQQCLVFKLRRTRDLLQVQEPERNGTLDHGQPWNGSREGNRQDRQQWTLRSRKPSIGDFSFKHEQSSQQQLHEKNAQVSTALPIGQICGRDDYQSITERREVPGDRKAISPLEVVKTKRRVWDILNAGPRHRFTCEGLLVSNCLVLDFGNNIERHGAIDDPNYGKKKDRAAQPGEAPEKTCPNCGESLALGCLLCEHCGFAFPPRKESRHESEADHENEILNNAQPPEWFSVREAHASLHIKKKGDGPPTLRVDYEIEEGNLTISEWVCLEHEGYARAKAVAWWVKRCVASPPTDIQSAVNLWHCGALAVPRRIQAKREGRFWRVLEYEFDEAPPETWSDEPVAASVPFDAIDDDDLPF